MKSIATALLACALGVSAGAACAQERTARSVMPPPCASNFPGKTSAKAPIRNRDDVYASVNADGTVLGPWIDESSVPLNRKYRHRAW